METSELLQKIKVAIDNNDVSRARELLKDGLQTPTADIYYQASRVAIDETQKQRFLEKALELDPFHQEAVIELRGVIESNKSTSLPTSKQQINQTTNQQTSNTINRGLIPVAIIIGIFCLLVFIGVSGIFSSKATNTYKSPTRTPRPTYTPTPTIKTYNVTVERDMNTDIYLKSGDVVKIKATGTIIVGVFTQAQASPDGVDQANEIFLSGYSVDSNFRHGSLLYGLSSEDYWHFCGSSCEFTVLNSGNGYLQFGINDQKQGDNTGSFKLQVTVTSR